MRFPFRGIVLYYQCHPLCGFDQYQPSRRREWGDGVAGGLCRPRCWGPPGARGVAAAIYDMLGYSFVECHCESHEYVKGMGPLEQARALAVESDVRLVLGNVCNIWRQFR